MAKPVRQRYRIDGKLEVPDRVKLEKWRVRGKVRVFEKRRKGALETLAALDRCIEVLSPLPYSDENVVTLRWLDAQRDALVAEMKKSGDWEYVSVAVIEAEPVESVKGVHLEWLD